MRSANESDTVAELVTSTDPESTEQWMERSLNTCSAILDAYNQAHILYYGSNAPGHPEMAEAFKVLRKDLQNRVQVRLNREHVSTMGGGRIIR